MKFPTFRSIAVVLVLAFVSAASVRAEIPAGWVVAGTAPKDYEFARDGTTAASGKFSASITAKSGATGFGTLMQVIDADDYRGARLKLSGYLRTKDAARAQMWMRVDGPKHKIVSFDNMDSRPVTGTNGWTRFEIVLNVPADSVDIAFGFFLAQAGTVWGDNFTLEQFASTAPVMSPTAEAPSRLKEPVNTDFEN